MENKNKGALHGVRILDFSRILAGPFCTMLLADLGADVIKVENPDRGDDTRHWGPPWVGMPEDGLSAYFVMANRNKRSLTLDLKSEAGQSLARRLAAKSHVLIENFKVGQMTKFGLGFEALRQSNPRLVYCSITGFGQTGPYRDLPGYDYAVQAMSGLMSVTGPEDGMPYKVGVAISDVFTGLFAASAILAALRHAEQTGAGQYVDMALLDSQLAALINVASNYLVSGEPPLRYGNGHPNLVPYQVFSASDGDFVVAVGNDRQFAKLCVLLGLSELAGDPRYATGPARIAHREELVARLQERFAHRTVTEWVHSILEIGIPTGPINDVPTILNDPQVLSRGLIQNVIVDKTLAFKMLGSPIKLSSTPAEIRLPPPRLGQHTTEILCTDLELTAADIARLHEQGVV